MIRRERTRTDRYKNIKKKCYYLRKIDSNSLRFGRKSMARFPSRFSAASFSEPRPKEIRLSRRESNRIDLRVVNLRRLAFAKVDMGVL